MLYVVQGSTWGQAYLIKDKKVALSYLGQRESSIGGYTTILTPFYPRDPKEKSFYTLVYIALPNNRLFIGSSSIKQIAHDIAHSKGVNGHNVEYLSKLIAFMKIELPHISDSHLYELEYEVKNIINENNLSEMKLFREAFDEWLLKSCNLSASTQSDDAGDFKEEDIDFKFISSVPERHLRCMKKF